MSCPVCGSGMVLSRTTNRRKDGTKNVFGLRCLEKKGTTICRSNGIRTDYADKYVLGKIANVANNDILIKSIVDNINKKNKSNAAPLQKEYQTLKKSLDTIESKKDKMLRLFEEGIIAKIDLSKRLDSLKEGKERLE